MAISLRYITQAWSGEIAVHFWVEDGDPLVANLMDQEYVAPAASPMQIRLFFRTWESFKE